MAVPTVARSYHHPGAAAHGIPGHAGRIVSMLGERAELHGLTDGAGALVHGDVADADLHEIRTVVRVVLDVDGPVLDLAPGVGRLTVPLLALGREVSALDPTPCVLAHVTRRVANGPELLRPSFAAIDGEARAFRLDRHFGAILLGGGAVAGHDATARAGLFACVRRHLRPGGRFVLTTVDHGAEDLPVELERVVMSPSGRAYRVHEYWEPSSTKWTLTILPLEPGPGPVAVCTARRRVFTSAMAERELTEAGLEIVARTELSDPGPRHPQVLIQAALPEGASAPLLRAVH